MTLVKDYLARKLIFENHPALDAERCLNTIQSRRLCTVCKEVCPCGVFDRDEPNWTRCDGCGVCATRCPTRCLRPSALLSGTIIEVCGRVTGDVTLACGEWDGPSDLRPSCLAALPWELIALFALDGTVQLRLDRCGKCPRKELLRHLNDTLAQVRSFLGNELFESSVVRCREGEPCPAPREWAYSRRDAFSLLLSKTKTTAASLLPGDENLSPDGLLCRRLLAHRLRHSQNNVRQLSWLIPSFRDNCTACGLCTKICPDKAIHRIDDHAQTAAHTWYMALIPWRCTGCGVCTQGCPTRSLSAPAWTPRMDPLSPVLLPIKTIPCPRCGEPLPLGQTEGLCARCAAETAAPLIW